MALTDHDQVDITAFIDQGNIYALFGQTETFAVNMADYTALTAVKNLPKGPPEVGEAERKPCPASPTRTRLTVSGGAAGALPSAAEVI
jgi:hypothetical protein